MLPVHINYVLLLHGIRYSYLDTIQRLFFRARQRRCFLGVLAPLLSVGGGDGGGGSSCVSHSAEDSDGKVMAGF